MKQYRRSYAKTTVMAAVAGTGCLSVGTALLGTAVVDWCGMQMVLILPLPIRVVAGILCLVGALVGYSIAAGGVLALRYDAKGRAVFE
ncbi:MAG: hypothetical protein ACT4PN_03475 [Nitrospiraceae bacterium]